MPNSLLKFYKMAENEETWENEKIKIKIKIKKFSNQLSFNVISCSRATKIQI
jgi:tellurite resistance-related uncharacterized protein